MVFLSIPLALSNFLFVSIYFPFIDIRSPSFPFFLFSRSTACIPKDNFTSIIERPHKNAPLNHGGCPAVNPCPKMKCLQLSPLSTYHRSPEHISGKIWQAGKASGD